MNKNLNLFIADPKNSIKDAMIKIKKNGTRTLAVVKKNKFLLGTLSEGDINSALINNFEIKSSIEKFYNKYPHKVKVNKINFNKINKIFFNKQIGFVPVVDNNNILQSVITWKDIFKLKKNSSNLSKIDVVIMAGGKGERLKPYTSILPKPLVPINNKPMLEHIILNFKFFNLNRFHLILNHESNLIKSYFKNKKNLNLSYVTESKPLGTIGGVKLLKKIKSRNFILSNCDTLFKFDFLEFYNHHEENDNFITLAVSNIKHKFSYGFCRVNNEKLLSINEKPSFNFIANTGIYIMNKEIVRLIPRNKKFDLNDLLDKCIKLNKKIGVFKISSNSWKDLGVLSDFNKVFRDAE